MKREIKDVFAAGVYFLYEKKLLKNSIKVLSIDETLDELLRTDKSMVRFGDGEIVMIKGIDLVLQQASPEIGRGLSEILKYEKEGMMVTIPDIFTSLSSHRKESRQFWKDHLLFCRKVYKQYCNPDRAYGSTFVSRCYYFAQDKKDCARWFAKIRKLWENKDVVIVEGSRTHNGVGNDLLDTAKSVERIICPPKDAYAACGRILAECGRYDTDRLFLLSAGVAAKFLAAELFARGYRVLDIGNLDMEYEWYLMHAEGKCPLAKHKITGEAENKEAGYHAYLQQIKCWL